MKAKLKVYLFDCTNYCIAINICFGQDATKYNCLFYNFKINLYERF